MLQHVTWGMTYLEVPNTSENLMNVIGPLSMKCTCHILPIILQNPCSSSKETLLVDSPQIKSFGLKVLWISIRVSTVVLVGQNHRCY